jgi:hypothetical protein
VNVSMLPSEKSLTRHQRQGMSLKEKLAYTLLAGLGISAVVFFGSRLIKKNRAKQSDAKSFQQGNPETTAKQIKMAFENDGKFGTDVKALRTLLITVKSKAELEKIRKAYQKQFNSPMFAEMSKELQSSEYREMLQIMEGKPEKAGQALTEKQYLAWAKRLKAAFEKTYSFFPGTDEAAIKAVFIEVPTHHAFIQIGKAYYKEYKANLITDLKSELEFWEYMNYMKLITTKPKGQTT